MMTLESFWEIIDAAWQDAPELNKKRINAIEAPDHEVLRDLGFRLEQEICEHLNNRLGKLDEIELTSFIHHLEERIYHIDREEIHQYTDGSDDGFLYCRCFITGMGKTYYDMIDNDPSKAAMDAEAELFGFSAYQVYEEKFGAEFPRYTHHSMESGSNRSAWH